MTTVSSNTKRIVQWILIGLGVVVLLTSYALWVARFFPLARLMGAPWLDQNSLPPVGHWQRAIFEFWLSPGVFLFLGSVVGVNVVAYLKSWAASQRPLAVTWLFALSNVTLLWLVPLLLVPAWLITTSLKGALPSGEAWQALTDYRTQWIPLAAFWLVFFVAARWQYQGALWLKGEMG